MSFPSFSYGERGIFVGICSSAAASEMCSSGASSWLRVCTKGNSKYPPGAGAGRWGITREWPELGEAGALIAMLMGDEGTMGG